MTRFFSTNVLLITLLLLAVIFESTSACGRRRRRHRHYGKRSVENLGLDTWDDVSNYEEQQNLALGKHIDPLVKNQRKAQRIENSLPVLDTSCGKVLCAKSRNYPTAAMTELVDESRRILKSGSSSVVFKNRGMDLQSFDSKIHDTGAPWTAHGRCEGNRNLVYPLEGYNRRHQQFYYIVNIPGFRQGVCTHECSSNSVGHYQAYSEEKLLVLPIGQRQFKIQDLKIRKILVPHDCPKKVF